MIGSKKEYFKDDLALFEEIVSDYNKAVEEMKSRIVSSLYQFSLENC